MIRALLLLLTLTACGDADGEGDCAELDVGPDRDHCLYEGIGQLPSDQAAGVVTRAGQIQDPIIRGAAVSRWVADHVRQISAEDGKALCGLLEGRDGSYCEKRLTAAHLHR